MFEGFELLDLTGPIGLLTFKGAIKMTLLAESFGSVSTKSSRSASHHPSFGVGMSPEQDYASFLASDGAIDVLIIPGGIGTRDPTDASHVTRDFIRQIAPRITTAIITVCTGSDLLASTGLLDNQSVRATTNVKRFKMVRDKHNHRGIEWLGGARWVQSTIQTPKPLEIWTSAGVSAGMDLALAFVAEKHGRDEALKIVRDSEYDWKELKNEQYDTRYDEEMYQDCL